MSTYSFAIIFFTSLGGTEPKPGRHARASCSGFVDAVFEPEATTFGHSGRADGLELVSPPARENTGKVAAVPAREEERKGVVTPGR